jgi:hypothetical protein
MKTFSRFNRSQEIIHFSEYTTSTNYWWLERPDSFLNGTEDLDFFSIKMENVEANISYPVDYEKYTMEQIKFELDLLDYYPGYRDLNL